MHSKFLRITPVAAALSWAMLAHAITPADKCEATKDRLAGSYTACRQNAEAKAVSTGNLPVYTKCDTRLATLWTRAEAKAVGACPTNGDATATQAFITTQTDTLATAVKGSGVPRCGDGAINVPGEQCDGGNLGGASCTSLHFLGGTLVCDANCKFKTNGCQTHTCGNGVKDGIESCDGSDLGGASCTSVGFLAGTLACNPLCQLDMSGCTNNLCGNGTRDGNEPCDGADLGGQSCTSLGFLGGTLACHPICQFNTSGCTNTLCGNGTRDGNEPCEGADLGGQSCTSLGFLGGTLACYPICQFNTSGCTNTLCGDGTRDGNEPCEGADLGGQSCTGLGFLGGTLACYPICQFNTSGCTNTLCGNGTKDGNEGCDGADLGGQSCTALGFASGTLACNAQCQIDTSACQAATTTCGNGVRQGTEQCDGADLGGQTCASLGYTVAGTLGCSAGCGFDTSGCIGQAFAQTGETHCSAASGGAVIPCAGTGQDGEIRAGSPLAYADNGDGTITDLNTGLIWEKKSDDGSIHDKDNTYSWGNAFVVFIAGINAANFAGYHDWRLPNAKELASIVDYEKFSPAVNAGFITSCPGGCSVGSCNCIQTTWYWASTSYTGNNNAVWAVNFNDGTLADGSKLQGLYARAVRGGLR